MEMAGGGCSPLHSIAFLKKFKNKILPSKEMINALFGSLNVNFAHLCPYSGFDELLLEALRLACEILIDDLKNSPSHYAIVNERKNCIDSIFNTR